MPMYTSTCAKVNLNSVELTVVTNQQDYRAGRKTRINTDLKFVCGQILLTGERVKQKHE